MKKLLKLYKSLPKEVKTMLALVGLGTPIGAIYFLRRFFPHTPLWLLIVYVAIAIGAICLLTFLIRLVFSRGRRKRTERLAADLATEGTGGPQSMDIAAAIKSNNEKFFNAIRDMRKTVGINVYELPWYIVIGDSGCGKTKLINEGGLTFSTGKPEGYQLGTLNYNWWFAEEAIFVDMAGRLCNPQDDNDRREWVSMLDTIAKGRKGFPINGAILCVSADHLLQDPPEKIERDANTVLERMRDLQGRLGVTFATYLVVTKCDKILGFMQFFDRAERDITVKNQIFGWSKPGDFNELHDPEKFKEEFGAVYSRLHDLRVRRLNDDAEEVDLGLAYSFPEEFRAMYDPLQIYVRTLFPMIKNPRAMKNLIFRGIYFTSATQEGGLILKHLTERLGQQAADQFAPLDELYPHKRPHFIKDVLVQKVVPEHGLVFRNEEQVLRNRRLNQVLKVGTVVVSLLLVTGLVWGSLAISKVIDAPRQNADKAATNVAHMEPSGAMMLAADVEKDAANLRKSSLAATVVSAGVGRDRPVKALERIRAKLAEKAAVTALRQVDAALRDGKLLAASASKEEQQAYLKALSEYAAWYGCRAESRPAVRTTIEGFKTMWGAVKDSALFGDPRNWPQVEWYFAYVHRPDVEWHNPAGLLASSDAGLAPDETIQAALGNIYAYFDRLAALDEDHPNDVLRGWIRLRANCERADAAYEELLAAGAEAERVTSLDGLAQFQKQFGVSYDTFEKSLKGCTEWGTPSSGTFLLNIPKLSKAVIDQRQEWVVYQQALRDALGVCGAPDDRLMEGIDRLRADRVTPPRPGLDRAFWKNLQALGIIDAALEYREGTFDDPSFADHVNEINKTYARFMTLTRGDGVNKPDTLAPTADAVMARDSLKVDRDRLEKAKFTVPEDLSAETVDVWAGRLEEQLGQYDELLASRERGAAEGAKPTVDASKFTFPEFWRPDELEQLDETTRIEVRLGEGTRLLRTITERLAKIEAESEGSWGIAELVSGWDEPDGRSPYEYPMPERRLIRGSRRRDSKVEETAAPERAAKPGRRARRPRRGEDEPSERRPAAPDTTGVPLRGAAGQIPACASREFLNSLAVDLSYVLDSLAAMGSERAYLADRGEGDALHERCRSEIERTTKAYLRQYLRGWSTAYEKKNLERLNDLRKQVSDWESLASQLNPRLGYRTNEIADEFQIAFSGILEAVPWASYDSDPRDGGYWDAFAKDSLGWAALSQWMRDSIDQSWQSRWNKQSLRLFVDSGRGRVSTAVGELPWRTVSSKFREAWEALAGAIASNERLEERARGGLDIPWGKLSQLQADYMLNDERFTSELSSFETLAENLLSAQITRKLIDVQNTYFQNQDCDDGWPYRTGKMFDAKGMDTVDFGKFKSFLIDVRALRDGFKQLESGLTPEVPGVQERTAFYKLCDGWREFLALSEGSAPAPKPLSVRVAWADPMEAPFAKATKPEEGCSQYATYCLVDIGLEGQDTGGDGLRTGCARADIRREGLSASWTWRSGELRELQARLQDPKADVKAPSALTLGTYSELALCAYLHRYAERQADGSWIVLHNFEVQYTPQDGALQKKTVGQKLAFTLDRTMPDAIPKLVEVPLNARVER